MVLLAARLTLREYTPDDFSLLHTIDADPVVTHMRGGTAIVEARYREQFHQSLAAQGGVPRHHYDFAIVLQRNQTLIGHCFLHTINARTREGSLGYFLHPSVWGHGFATEATTRLLQFGFDDLRLHRISAGCIDTNTASRRVLEKVGMRCEGRLREDRLTDAGDRYDTLLYGLLEREWRIHQQS